MGACVMKLKMILIMGTILIVGFVFTIWGLMLAAGKTSRHERRMIKDIQDPENEEIKLRLVK